MGWKKYFLLVLITLSLTISGFFGHNFLHNSPGTTTVAQATSNSCDSVGDGHSFYSLGQYHQAVNCYQKLLDTYKKNNNREGEADTLTYLGSTYRHLGEYSQAIDSFQQSLAINREIKNPQIKANALMGLGGVYHRQENYQQAIDYQQQALAIYRKIPDTYKEAECLTRLGDVHHRLAKYEQAIDYHQQSLNIYTNIGNSDGEAYALTGLGNAFWGLRRYKEAETALHKAITIRENIRRDVERDDGKVSIFERQALTYYLLQLVLAEQNKLQKALEISELGRNRALLEILFQRINEKPKEAMTLPSLTVEEIQQIARQQNATLVEYSVLFDKFLHMWVIPPQGEIKFRSFYLPNHLPKDISLKKLVEVSRQSIGVRGLTNDNPTSQADKSSTHLQQLHQLLIKPIAEFLPQDEQQRVIFIPHQELFLVPFVALQDDKYKYLIEKHTILTAPSIQTLSLTQKRKQTKNNPNASVPPSGASALVVGNPTMPKQKVRQELKPLDSLPGAEIEAKKIAKMLNTTPLIGDQATESVIVQKMASAKVIHLATHGLLDSINAIDSPGAIALAPSSKDDGFLTTSEIMEHFGLPEKSPLQAELVVLSACNTGRGDIKGEGVVGLSRSFIAANVPTVVVSLWKVPDDDTVKLMTDFYTNIYKNKFDKAKAMREAMLSMVKDNNGNHNPEAWAAFTVVGKAE
ncbi:CHAT domain-containing protein [Tolypothrix sp. PCC 7601]|uniref:CHAT domain-containing protein n=1 Tax=Tolypothrix sp. PCC 7601 TaxID=1188 RepID=UPI0005EAC1D2|nr:CHAT domain-containing tetratricopeptide repeat protein [Tolypothrix sp. PCC 7601]EKE97308.1 tetratricopeptide repeat protein [Tolypothrix sp. PCC 7601]